MGRACHPLALRKRRSTRRSWRRFAFLHVRLRRRLRWIFWSHAPRLHFNEHDGLAVRRERQQIALAATHLQVPTENAIAFLLQVFRGERLAFVTQRVAIGRPAQQPVHELADAAHEAAPGAPGRTCPDRSVIGRSRHIAQLVLPAM